MNVDLLKENIAEVKSRIADDHMYVRETEQEIAEFLCPFSVGDEVLTPEGEKQIIASILYASYCSEGYEVRTFKFKVNGERYKYSRHVYSMEGYKLCE